MILGWIFCHLGSILETKLEPCWPPFSAQGRPRSPETHPRRCQDAPRRSKMPPKMLWIAQDRPRRPETPPNLPQSPPDLDFGVSRLEFLEGLTCKNVNFWNVWGSFFKCEFLPDYMSFHTRICKMIIRLLSYYVTQLK